MPHDLRLVFPGPDPLLFEQPRTVMRAFTPQEARYALDNAQSELDGGAYCAGYLSYELGAAFAGPQFRPRGEGPLLVLGIYDQTSALPIAQPAPYRIGTFRPRISRLQYDAALGRIAGAIYEGDVYQVNYTVPFDFAFSGDARTLFEDLAATADVRYAAYVEDGGLAILSLSPELFLEIQDRRIRAKPMKGTAPPDRPGELHTPKNRAEHVMIVDLLRNDLQRVCSDVEVPHLYDTERYPTLTTMTSTIEGTLPENTSLRALLQATFPCGSITGAPKRAAMSLIESLEPSPRGVYTGSIGYAAPDGTSRWNVAIRTLQIDRAAMRGRFDAGGGIVADSSPAAEWDELMLKTVFTAAYTTPFALLETFEAGGTRIRAHLERLRVSAAAFDVPFDEAAALDAVCAVARGTLIRLRLAYDGTLSLSTGERAQLHGPVRLRMSAERTASSDPLLAHKTSWRDAYDRGLQDARVRGCFDSIFLNERGEVTEGARSNIFVQAGDVLLTPPLRCGVLPGILRAELLAQGRAQERVLYEDDLHAAQALYAGNSARGLLRAELVKELSGV